MLTGCTETGRMLVRNVKMGNSMQEVFTQMQIEILSADYMM